MTIPPSSTQITVEQLDRYLQGAATLEDQARVQAWVRAYPEAQAFVERVTHLPAGSNLDAEWRLVAERIGGTRREEERSFFGGHVSEGEKSTPHDGPGMEFLGGRTLRQGITSFGNRTLRRWMAAAGTALVLGVIALVLRPARLTSVGITRTYVTHEGQQATVTMNDGTRFVMSPNTTLRLHDFAVQSRMVDIDGEAYVNVAHASGLPFIVRGGSSRVQVLGTGFLIRHRAGSSYTRVAVTDGKVRLTTQSRGGVGVTLAEHQVGELIDSTVQVSGVDELTPKTEWIRDQLVFRDTPLSAILVTIGRWYGYQFRYSDSTLAQRTLTIGLSTQSSMKALAEIERVLHVDLSVTGDTVTLISQPPRRMNGTSRLKAYDVWIPTQEVGR